MKANTRLLDLLFAEIRLVTGHSFFSINKSDYSSYVKIEKNKIITLNLNSLEIDYLPERIGEFKDLEILFLHGNRLVTLPDSIGNLTNLRILELMSNNLVTLPENLGKLVNLNRLNLRFNDQMTSLPESIGNLTNLVSLFADNYKLISLPESIANLVNLRQLYLEESIHYNKSLPKNIKQWLDDLTAKGCQIR